MPTNTIEKTKRKFAAPDERMTIPVKLLIFLKIFGRIEFTTDDGNIYLITKLTQLRK